MDERALRYFLAVVREGSIRRAAERLNVAASAISRQIADLEADCALPLLERLPRGVVPTEAGQAVAQHALQQEEDTAELRDYLRQLRGLRQGVVRIRCGEGFVADLLDNGLPPFAEVYPEIRVKLDLGGTTDVLASVGQGEVDIGLAYNPVSGPDIRSVAIARQPLQLVMLPDHPLAAREAVALRDLAEVAVALLDESHGVRQLLRRVEADQRFRLTPRLEASSIDVLRRYALGGHAVTLLPAFVVAPEIQAGRLVVRPLTDRLMEEATSHILVRAQRRLPKPVERLIGFLSTRMEAFRASTL
jgi:DNA-binding transcriptional LysR family regulator